MSAPTLIKKIGFVLDLRDVVSVSMSMVARVIVTTAFRVKVAVVMRDRDNAESEGCVVVKEVLWTWCLVWLCP